MSWLEQSLIACGEPRRLAAVALLGCVTSLAGGPVDVPLVVTQVPFRSGGDLSSPAKASQTDGRFAGARLVLVAPDKSLRVLSGGFDSACDPNVSFDAKTILFAGRKTRANHWRIYEVGVTGGTARAVSPEHQDARQPIYATRLFTLDSPEPWFTILYSARETFLNEAGQPLAASLYNVTLDGQELRRLTYNPNLNRDPFQMWDGRVIYSAERRPNQPDGYGGRTGLYAIHVEGADMELFGGELGKRVQRTPCATPGGLVVFIESDHPTPDGAGQLACVEDRRPHATYRPLTRDPAYAFVSPAPWRENRVIVARRLTEGRGTWGVFCFDADQGRCEAVFDSPDYDELQAVPLLPRINPDGHSTVVDTKTNTGIFYGLNCYDADQRMAAHLQTGMVKRVRLIEGVVQTPTPASSPTAGRGPFVPRRLVGEAPVEADGSFNVEVPADTPLLLQTLDERGLALGNCGWIWVKPKEKRGCIGCHEDPERIPENEYVLALRRPSNRLALPPAERRSISFRDDIVPILQKHCATADCHGSHDTPLYLPLTGQKPSDGEILQAYEALTVPAHSATNGVTWPASGKYVDAGRARTSWLVWQLTGTDTSRPWDRDTQSAAKARKVKSMPPPGKGPPLGPEELRTLIQWIDLGAQLDAVKPTEPETRKLADTK